MSAHSRPRVKGPLFLTLWAWLSRYSLKTRLFLKANKLPFSLAVSLSLILSSSIPPLLSRKQNGWVGTGMHHLTPAQSTQPEVTETRPPTTGLIVDILRFACTLTAKRCKACSLCYVVCHYSTASQMLICPIWLWVSLPAQTDIIALKIQANKQILKSLTVNMCKIWHKRISQHLRWGRNAKADTLKPQIYTGSMWFECCRKGCLYMWLISIN